MDIKEKISLLEELENQIAEAKKKEASSIVLPDYTSKKNTVHSEFIKNIDNITVAKQKELAELQEKIGKQ